MDGSWARIIVHADMDAFFAAVEQLDRPELRGKPVLVGHPGPRGVVSTASYEARPYGVGSAMSMAVARRRCPDAIVVPPRFSRYQEVSREVMDVLRSFSPKVEALSLDEAFLDMSGSQVLFGGPLDIGRKIKEAIYRRTGLTVSVGISTTKYVAKVASDHKKPDGLWIVPEEQVRAFLSPLPLRKLWGVGPKTEERLRALGLRTIGDVARASPGLLESRLGSHGKHLVRLAQGIDPREVVTEREVKSVGSEVTLETDVVGEAAIGKHLLHSADRVAERLRRKGLQARGVRLKLKTADFVTLTRQRRLDRPTDAAGPLYEGARELLRVLAPREPMRLVGLAAIDLQRPDEPVQTELFGAGVEAERKLSRAVDEVTRRFGAGTVRRASELE